MLNTILRLNALSCVGFGVIFSVFSASVAPFIGQIPELALQILGIGLLFNGMFLLWASIKSNPAKILIQQFAIGDLIWVITTAVLLISNIWITTNGGKLASVLVALMVGYFGLRQWQLSKVLV